MEIQQPINYEKTQNYEEDKKNITIKINGIIEKMILKILVNGFGLILDGNKIIFFVFDQFFF